ncbi:FAD-dependent oxidoreductase [Paenibacillus tritici]|uniref:FAD-dependent oxidoreductase n=1 Tax=Paenibacillus tritici TaxID=1873425 RepID=UPI001BA94816|nr:FAD-dependent oxidoreductase [Paenibacillus tritici]QUL53129.1 FAD-dependent oxidoreductase [Paenibacillus tritici]
MSQLQAVRADVLVVGGGTAGCVAAIAAAEEGARVILVESDTALGGVATRGGIHRYYYGSPGGLQEGIDRRTAEAAAVFGGKTKGFHPDAKRVVLAALCRDLGIGVWLDSVVYEVIKEADGVAGVRLLTPAGPLEVRAGVTIDSTGNAHLVRMAGGKLRHGRQLDGIYHNYSFIPRRVLDGEIGYDNLDAGWVDPYDPWDVSRAFIRGREWVRQGGEQGARYFAVSSMLGVREGGLIEGDATIVLRDYIEDRPSPEVIARSYSHLDNHGFDTGNESEFSQLWIAVMGLFVKGLWCDIPYGALLPKGLERLLVAGRALSAERDVSMGIRMQKDMHKTGEAAGVAAALSLKADCTPRQLDRSLLQKRLVERGVLEQEDLQRSTGRNLRFRQGDLAGLELDADKAVRYSEQLAGYFGTEESWKAVWLLGRSSAAAGGPEIIPLLAGKLEDEAAGAAFCSAITLAMLGREEPVPYLLGLIAARDSNKLSNHPKCVPFWVASFVLLRMLRSPAGLKEAVIALAEQPGAVHSTFLLDYLSSVLPLLSREQRAEAAAAVKAWLGSAGLGEDYRMHGDRPESLRWSLELRAAAFLSQAGEDDKVSMNIAAASVSDSRGYVRNAAARLIPGSAAGTLDKESAVPLLGTFDLAVIGAGTAAVICAAALGLRGKRVVLLAPGSALLTEVTRCRVTAFQGAKEQEDHAVSRLIGLLRREGAWNGAQLEPVRTQLAADRFLEEAGVSVLYEARTLGSWKEGERKVVELATKNGRCIIYAGELVPAAGGYGNTRPAAPGTLTAVLTCTEPFGQEADGRWSPWLWTASRLLLRLRPGYYPEEAYLDIRWPEEAAGTAASGELLMVPAVGELRWQGRIPDTAALAYIADDVWPEGLSGEAGSGLNPEDTFIADQITAGLAAAARLPDH